MLSDVGATVIKVEEPGLGDGGRGILLPSKDPQKENFNGYNESLNRGKRSIELDLKAPASKPVLEKLIQWADVITENFKHGTMDQIGWGYETCKKLNPRVIYCANSGFGPDGEWNNRGSFDAIAQGMSGAMVETGGGPSHTPKLVSWGAADQIGAMSFAFHILAAVIAQKNSPDGMGQKLECSQLGAMVQFQSIQNVGSWNTGEQRDDNIPPGWQNVGLSYYKCGDGRWLTVAPSAVPAHWPRFCKAVGLERLLEDPKTKNRAVMEQNRAYFREQLEQHFATAPADEWIAKIGPTGVPTGPVLTHAEVMSHPQIRANNYVVDVEHPAFGKITTNGVPAKYSGTPNPAIRTAPDLGEHTEEILKDIVGLDDAGIQALAKEHATTPGDGYKPPGWMGRHKWKKPRAKL